MRTSLALLPILVTVVGVPQAAWSAPKTLRDLADATATLLNSYRTAMQTLADQQSRLSDDNERRLRNLNQMRAHNEAYIAQRLAAFQLGQDKSASDIYGLVTATSASDVVATSLALASVPAPAAPVPVQYDATQVAALVKSLRDLAKPPSSFDQVTGLVGYGQDVVEAYETKIKAKGSGDPAQAAQSTTDTAQQKLKATPGGK